ncbi:hypothetical protein PSPO01_07519 [Paraphaeosphaeria sporulosa]
MREVNEEGRAKLGGVGVRSDTRCAAPEYRSTSALPPPTAQQLASGTRAGALLFAITSPFTIPATNCPCYCYSCHDNGAALSPSHLLCPPHLRAFPSFDAQSRRLQESAETPCFTNATGKLLSNRPILKGRCCGSKRKFGKLNG